MLSGEYIFQEMLEQEKITVLHQSLPPPEWPNMSGKLLIAGSGDSYCAALFGHWLMEKRQRVSGLPALEACRAAQHLAPGDVLIGISVSGRTVRILEAASEALARGAHVVAVTDNLKGPLADLATVVWPIHASPSEELSHTSYHDYEAKQYVGYHHDVAQTKTFWAVLLTLIRAAQADVNWHVLLEHTRLLLSSSFYQPLLGRAQHWAQGGQTFFLAAGSAKILTRFASYKMYEFNRLAHFAEIEEYCHTHYFITRTGDTVAFVIDDQETAARAAEIVPVLLELFAARILWLQPQSLGRATLPAGSRDYVDLVELPDASGPTEQWLNFVLALEWITYCTGRIGAPDINTFHAGYDTERLVAGSLRTIRRSVIRASVPGMNAGDKEPTE